MFQKQRTLQISGAVLCAFRRAWLAHRTHMADKTGTTLCRRTTVAPRPTRSTGNGDLCTRFSLLHHVRREQLLSKRCHLVSFPCGVGFVFVVIPRTNLYFYIFPKSRGASRYPRTIPAMHLTRSCSLMRGIASLVFDDL